MIEDYISINNELDSKIKDILLGKSLSMLYKDKLITQSNILQADSLFERATPLFKDESLLQIVANYRDLQITKLQNQVNLNPGVDAPDFLLSDSIGNYYKLSDFRDKVVFLNFWTTYCIPCIESIPEKNNLVDKFKDHPFELVNICMDYRPGIWRRVIEKNHFSGTHLICIGNWENQLRDNYLVQTVPHYVLIDQKGKIICNGCGNLEEITNQLESIIP